MKTFKDLNKSQKLMFENIEELFLKNKFIDRVQFAQLLGILINKYKIKLTSQNKKTGKPSTAMSMKKSPVKASKKGEQKNTPSNTSLGSP